MTISKSQQRILEIERELRTQENAKYGTLEYEALVAEKYRIIARENSIGVDRYRQNRDEYKAKGEFSTGSKSD